MQGLCKIAAIREYCDYVERHLDNIRTAWGVVRKALGTCSVFNDLPMDRIDQMILEHDLSKFSAQEFIQYADWSYGPHGRSFDSNTTPSTEVPAHNAAILASDRAWAHHKECNPHHHQTWNRAPESFPGEHKCNLVCMVVDWEAMRIEFGDTAEKFYKTQNLYTGMPRWADAYLHTIFAALRVVKHEESDERV